VAASAVVGAKRPCEHGLRHAKFVVDPVQEVDSVFGIGVDSSEPAEINNKSIIDVVGDSA
jgi:hypothetical protein